LNEATEQIISKAFNFRNAPIDQLVTENTDYFFVTYNGYNEYYLALRNSAELYLKALQKNNKNKEDLIINILISSVLVFFAAVIITVPVLFKVNQTKAEVLRLFLDIPEKTMKMLYSKCEMYYSNIQMGEDEEDVALTEQDGEEMQETKHNDNEGTTEYEGKKKAKKFKNSNNTQGKLVLAVMGVVMILQAYFIYTYLSAKTTIDTVNQLLPELNYTAWMVPATRTSLNVQRLFGLSFYS
jgi:flagellar basal body-associated protein FliL